MYCTVLAPLRPKRYSLRAWCVFDSERAGFLLGRAEWMPAW